MLMCRRGWRGADSLRSSVPAAETANRSNLFSKVTSDDSQTP